MKLFFCTTSMEKSAPSRLSNLRELISTIQLTLQVQVEVSAILEDYETRIYALEADNKRLLADYRAQQDKIRSLENRYSELLYRFSSVSK